MKTPLTDAVVDKLIPNQFLPQELIDIARRLESDRARLIVRLKMIANSEISIQDAEYMRGIGRALLRELGEST